MLQFRLKQALIISLGHTWNFTDEYYRHTTVGSTDRYIL